jgi:hypothetical protein
MAQTTNHLRDLLEKIKGDAERALALLPERNRIAISRVEMHCLRTPEAFRASGHRCSRRPLSEMQRRLLSVAVTHYAAH